MPMSRIGAGLGGSLSIRALATHVDHFIIDTGVTRIDTAGDVGDTSSIAGLPKWRGTLSIAYQGDSFGLDASVRYFYGGNSSPLLTQALNTDIGMLALLDPGRQLVGVCLLYPCAAHNIQIRISPTP